MAHRVRLPERGRLLLLLGAACCAFALGWFALGMVHRPPSAKIAWLPLPPSTVLAAAQCWITAGANRDRPAARRFWRALSAGIALIGVATLASVYETWPTGGVLVGPPGPIAMTFYCAALGVALWGFARLPTGVQTAQQRLTLWYDLGTVMLAVALFGWHFGTRSLVAQGLGALPQTAASLIAMVAGCVAVFTLVRTVFTGSRTVDSRSLLLIAVGSLAGSFGAALGPLLVHADYLNVCHYTVPIAMVFMNWSGYAQRQVSSGARPPRARRERTFSLLPYVAVAATDALLLVTVLRRDDGDRGVVAAGAVALTALVSVRQLISFRENARLLTQIAVHEGRFRSLVQNSSDIVSIITADGTVTYLSPSVHHVLGVDAAGWAGRPVWAAVHPDDRVAAAAGVASIVRTPGGTVSQQMRLAHRDGSWRWFEVISSNLLDDPSVKGIVSNSRDITEERALQQRLHHEATHDPLTGLPNRALFGKRLASALSENAHVVVGLIDLDGFKAINDTLGHAAGDRVLVAVSSRLRECVERTDTVARLGGDEFALLLTGPSAAHVETIVESIQASLGHPIMNGAQEMVVGASIGVTDAAPGELPDRLLHRADLAMYESKARRDGRYTHTALVAPGT